MFLACIVQMTRKNFGETWARVTRQGLPSVLFCVIFGKDLFVGKVYVHVGSSLQCLIVSKDVQGCYRESTIEEGLEFR